MRNKIDVTLISLSGSIIIGVFLIDRFRFLGPGWHLSRCEDATVASFHRATVEI
jgi:hypothetical protein